MYPNLFIQAELREKARVVREAAEKEEKDLLAQASHFQKAAEDAAASLIIHHVAAIDEPWKGIYRQALTTKNTAEVDHHSAEIRKLVAGK